jgi:Ca2+-binding RTX toxin-like protein
MATTQDYAVLSLYVYTTLRPDDNRPQLPTGWTLAEPLHRDDLFGFSYGVFRGPGGEIVLAYTGTNESIDWASNALAGTGILPSPQVAAAAKAYVDAKAAYGPNITLSGHSLGGGLASVMAVWFNRPAVVFDEGPFEATALNPLIMAAVAASLGLTGTAVPSEFLSFIASYPLVYGQREAQVANHYLQGEVLASLRAAWPTVLGSDTPISVNGTSVTAVQLHSMALYTAAKLSPSFVQATYVSDRVLPLVMDENLYGYNTGTSTQRNFLVDLIRSEQSAAAGQGKLTHFASDLNKLGINIAGLNLAAQNAIIAQGIEWYYWQGPSYAGKEFFTQTGPLLQYTINLGDTTSTNQSANKALFYVSTWLDPLLQANGGFSASYNYDQWSIVAGDTAATATAKDATKSQIYVGGGGADTFTGGNLGDVILAGAGNDTINGGLGNDQLYGGAGQDTYLFSGAWGNDTITDSDGLGSIKLGDASSPALTGGKKLLDNVWESDDHSVIYTLTGAVGAQNLIIGQRSTPGAATVSGTITVNHWVNGQLGITLDGAFAAQTPGITLVNGDQHAPVSGTSYNWSATSGYDAAGNLIGGVAELNFADVIYGSAAADKITGLGGNDALGGGAGDDRIEGGDGDDLIAGGAGADILLGGAGNDYITGSAELTAPQRSSTTDSWALPTGSTVVMAGANWGVYRNAAGAVINNYISAVPADLAATPGDYIDAGIGNDMVLGSNGADWVEGGAGDDFLWGMAGNDVMNGGDGADIMTGDSGPTPRLDASRHGNDVMDGGAGDDVMVGEGGSDVLLGGLGADILLGDQSSNTDSGVDAYAGGDLLDGGDGDDFLVGGGQQVGQIDRLYGGDGNDVLDGDGSGFVVADTYQGEDELFGEAGNDELVGGGGGDYLDGGIGDDVMFGDGSATIAVAVAINGADELDGGDGLDTLVGGGGDDSLWGGNDADYLWGDDITTITSDYILVGSAHGKDYLDGGAGVDQLVGGGDADELFGGIGNDVLFGDSDALAAQFHGADYLDGEDGDDTLIGGGKADTLFGGIGNDTLVGDDAVSKLAGELHDADYLNGEEGDDFLVGGGGKDVLVGGAGADYLVGDIEGSSLAAQYHGNDVLEGGEGNDTLIGSGGNDTLSGGAGNDFLTGDDALSSSVVGVFSGDDNLDGGDGDDSLLGGKGNDTIVGGAGNDLLFGGEGADVMDGGVGIDYLSGGAGNDTYIVDTGDTTVELAGGGIDTVQSAVTWILAAEVENLTLTGAAAINGTGNALNNTLSSAAGNNVLDGGLGVDTLSYASAASGVSVSLALTVAQNTGGAGTDTVSNFEHLTGSAFNDTLTGDAGANTLIGGAGNDTMAGGLGNDTYEVKEAGDVVIENVGEGSDAVWAYVNYTLGANIETLVLSNAVGNMIGTGNALNNTIIGSNGNDTLDGGAGNDNLNGAAGFDTLSYASAASGVSVSLALTAAQNTGGAGTDTVSNFEHLTGSAFNDSLTGDAGANTLIGGAGNDTMTGGLGNDTYEVKQAGDVVVENAAEGIDTVWAYINYTLTANVESLVFSSAVGSRP